MAASAPSKMTLKLLVDKKANKVLFGEAGKEAVDFLCSILTLPVGTVITLLSKQGMVGCLHNLYQSVENLNDDYIQPNQQKDTVLKPAVYNSTEKAPLLSLTGAAPKKTIQFCRCTYCPSYSNRHYVSNVKGTKCPGCSNTMTADVTFVEGNNVSVGGAAVAGGGAEGGFVKGVVTYMLMDDLSVAPMSTITGITLLNKFNVKDVGALEEKMVVLDMTKGLKLLKTAFQSKKVLTEVFL